jgi:ketosteroid isomerase-like protein
MYRLIVAARVRTAWRLIQQRRTEELLQQFAPRFTHRFAGDHALAGTRHSRAQQAEWFARLFRVFPDIEFVVRDVVVAGWPWRTRVMAVVDVSLPSRPDYGNVVMQRLELRWGRITSVENLEDTQRLAGVLHDLAADGTTEAAAPAITA